MFYDKDWVEKQERGFTAWLNFILTPSEFSSEAVEKKGQQGTGPTMGVTGIVAVMQGRHRNILSGTTGANMCIYK